MKTPGWTTPATKIKHELDDSNYEKPRNTPKKKTQLVHKVNKYENT